jgi:hypothetical protein
VTENKHTGLGLTRVEPNIIHDSSAFQRFDAVGNYTKSLERLESIAIGPQLPVFSVVVI